MPIEGTIVQLDETTKAQLARVHARIDELEEENKVQRQLLADARRLSPEPYRQAKPNRNLTPAEYGEAFGRATGRRYRPAGKLNYNAHRAERRS